MDGGGQMSIEARLSAGVRGVYPGIRHSNNDTELRGQ